MPLMAVLLYLRDRNTEVASALVLALACVMVLVRDVVGQMAAGHKDEPYWDRPVACRYVVHSSLGGRWNVVHDTLRHELEKEVHIRT